MSGDRREESEDEDEDEDEDEIARLCQSARAPPLLPLPSVEQENRPSSSLEKDQMSLGSVAQEEKDLNLSLLHVEEADSLTVSLDSCVPDTVH